MTKDQIQANKPDGATHYNDYFASDGGRVLYYKDDGKDVWLWSDGDWIKSILKYHKSLQPL